VKIQLSAYDLSILRHTTYKILVLNMTLAREIKIWVYLQLARHCDWEQDDCIECGNIEARK
jgi:hypothetical protein